MWLMILKEGKSCCHAWLLWERICWCLHSWQQIDKPTCSEEVEHKEQPCSESNRLSAQPTLSLETKMRALRRRHSSLLTALSPLTCPSCPQGCNGSQVPARVLEGVKNTQYHSIWVLAQFCFDVLPFSVLGQLVS